MRATKGLQIDTRPAEQIDGTYPFAKNGIQYDLNGSTFNEPGFAQMAAVVPYVLNGVIETDKYPVLISTNNVNTAVGFFNSDTGTYIPIIDDATWSIAPALIGFKVENYVTGTSQRNYKGELVISISDKTIFPIYLNCDNPNIKSIDDLRLFPYYSPPTITVNQSQGGVLMPGTYYVAIAYWKNDGTTTPYTAVSAGTFVTPGAGDGTINTNKSLDVIISNADTNYDQISVAIISRINGASKAVVLNDPLPISGTNIEFNYTGINPSTDTGISEITTPPTVYNQVQTIGQLNDALYLGGLQQEPDLNDMQPYALMVGLQWISQLMDATNPPPEHVSGAKKSRMHGETYAFYIRYSKRRGGVTKWFTLAGETPTSGDLAASSALANSGYTGGSVPVFKVEDTIHYYDPVASTGACGVWQNTTETYPDTVDFDASAFGGRNLRGQKVLHHKMPSLNWCKNNLYSTVDNYGKTQLDILGIQATGVRIPDKYIGIINGYEIGYAIRGIGNMTVLGQGALLHGVSHPATVIPQTTLVYSSGGNFTTSIFNPGGNEGESLHNLRLDTMRFHGFDTLFYKPSMTPDLIMAQFKLSRTLNVATDYLENGNITAAHDAPLCFLMDYTVGDKPIVPSAGSVYRALKRSFYLPNVANVYEFVNLRHENCFAGELLGTVWPLTTYNSSLRVAHYPDTEPSVGMPAVEQTFLVNLISLKADIYANFYSQQLASAGTVKALTDTTPFWGGDTFNCDYCFTTYGRHNSEDDYGTTFNGKKVARRIVCESIANIAARYQIAGNNYSEWYPNNALAPNQPTECFLTYEDRSQDPNQFGYSANFNDLNDLLDSTTFSPFAEYIYGFPYRIHRGGKNLASTRPRSWRTFLALDYYELQKNMGRPIHLEGMDDRLLIHCENCLFITQDKTAISGGSNNADIAITLGTGDIFQFEPQEVMSSKLGYAGLQSDLACYRTPMGYFFVDSKQGEVYLFKGKLQNLNAGINTFLRDFLKVPFFNPYIGNGITVGWDQKYKRLLLTVKNVTPSVPTNVKMFVDTPAFWSALTVGDVVNYKGRLVQYNGLNDTIYNCPIVPIPFSVNWTPGSPYCMLDGNGNNTGLKGYLTRTRTGGSPDPYTENNLPNSGIGPYFPPVKDLTTCPLPIPVTSWIGTDPFCFKSSGSQCPTGWALSSDGTYCYQILTEPAISSGGGTIKAKHYQLSVYSQVGTVVHKLNGFNVDGTWNTANPALWPNIYNNDSPARYPYANHIVMTSGPFINGPSDTSHGRLNATGIWNQASQTYAGTLGFARQINIPTAGVYYIGVGSDDYGTIKIDGNTIVQQIVANACGPNYLNAPSGDGLFKHWILYPVQLTAGLHMFELISTNTASQGILGMEIYLGTEATLLALTSVTSANYLFSTVDVVDGDNFDVGNWYCSDPTYQLVNIGGVYSCQKILTQIPASSPGANTGLKGYNSRARLINGIADGYTEPNTNVSPAVGIGPYIPPVIDLVLCSWSPIPTPGSPSGAVITGTVAKSCSDQGCTVTGDVSLEFNFDIPLPVSISVWIGELIQTNAGVVEYTGNSIFTPPVGAVANNVLAYAGGVSTPFEVNIPAGVTNFVISTNIYQTGYNGVFNADWRCNGCQYPITDLYFQLQNPGAYSLVLRGAQSPGIGIHNV